MISLRLTGHGKCAAKFAARLRGSLPVVGRPERRVDAVAGRLVLTLDALRVDLEEQ
jgi:hypothetical protein